MRQLARLDVRIGEVAVALRAADGDPLFADLADEWNALRVMTAVGRVFAAHGRGANRAPTAESLWAYVSDLTDPGLLRKEHFAGCGKPAALMSLDQERS